jgi:acetyl-CoA carboxylase carboxyl transferase beta subunit/acetyl-CoA carboxylase carboxyl transferase alpha subunit
MSLYIFVSLFASPGKLRGSILIILHKGVTAMSINKTFAQTQLKLSSALHSLTVPDLPHLHTDLFPMTLRAKLLAASNSLPPSQQCPRCKAELGAANKIYSQIAVCDFCGYHFVCPAFKRIAHLADTDSFHSIGHAIEPVDFLHFTDKQPYSVRLRKYQQQTGLDDAILVGRCRIGGIKTVLVVLDFRFMGGSMGSVMGELVTFAFEYARKHRLPVVTVATSGGARMQEGIISLMQMPKTAAAIQRFHAAGLFYVSILASPTTGGVFASFASLGDVMIAEPEAIIGFAGPRVAEQATGHQLPSGSHRAEMLLASGHLDAITARADLPQVIATLLKATAVHPKQHHTHNIQTNKLPQVSSTTTRNTAWESVQLTRHPQRPTARDYIRYLSPNFLELQGDRCNGNDPTIVTGLGEIKGRTVLFIGQERHPATQSNSEEATQIRPRPEGYRKAIRIMKLAAKLHCPLITFIDTIGADPSIESEQHGIASSLAHSLSTMSSLPVPIVTTIIGEGASGGAVALAVADHILMLQNAIYEVIAPEGAATILYRDASRARQVAEQLKLTAFDCLNLGVVDAIIPEPPGGAHIDPSSVMQALEQHLLYAITNLETVPVKHLLTRRYRKFRRYGYFQHKHYLEIRAFTNILARLLHQLQNPLRARVSSLVARLTRPKHSFAT